LHFSFNSLSGILSPVINQIYVPDCAFNSLSGILQEAQEEVTEEQGELSTPFLGFQNGLL